MAYDPKKKRPSTKSLDSVVDEIFGEESTQSKSEKPSASKPKATKAKKTPQKKSKSSSSAKKSGPKTKAKPKAKAKPEAKKPSAKKVEPKESIPDNVTPLYPESQDTPLVMQPQVWIATAIGALALLLLFKKRKRS